MEQHWQVVQTRLPGGEEVPTLVDARTWLPARVAQRYVMRDRRYNAKPGTIRNELYSLARLYTWFSTQADTAADLDDFLVQGNTLTARQLDALVAFLQTSRKQPRVQHDPDDTLFLDPATKTDLDEEAQLLQVATFDRHARAIHRFLHFAIDSAQRGGQPCGDWDHMARLREQLRAYFDHAISSVRLSVRMDPLTEPEGEAILAAFGPVYTHDPSGRRRLALPIRFEHGHFTPRTRLRNWLMYRLGLDCGLRRGEILKLTLNDIISGRQSGLKLIRRPDDAGDSRTVLPAVKTNGRELPTTPEVDALMTAYISGPQPGRRVGGRTHYLFTSENGDPLSISTTAKLINTFRRHSGVPHLRWHTLRHTWAEAFITDCLGDGSEPISNDQKESAFDRLKYAGGWTSNEAPRHYIKRWLENHAQAFMRERNERLYDLDPFDFGPLGPRSPVANEAE